MEIKTGQEIKERIEKNRECQNDYDYLQRELWINYETFRQLVNNELMFRQPQNTMFDNGYYHAFEIIEKQLLNAKEKQ